VADNADTLQSLSQALKDSRKPAPAPVANAPQGRKSGPPAPVGNPPTTEK
jgi:hypothetical protein